MVYYKYNGEKLPALPDYDTEAYPYAVIAADYCLYVTDLPIVVYNTESSCNENATGNGIRYYNYGDNGWASPEKITLYNNGEDDRTSMALPKWSNHDVLKAGTGEVYLPASEPEPIEVPPTDDGETGGGDADADTVPVLAELFIKKGGKIYQIGGAQGIYTPISITSFSNNAGTKEYGELVTSVVFSWELNKPAKTITLDGIALNASATSCTINNLSITHGLNKTWTLVVTDKKGAVAEASNKIAFANGIYFGAVAEPTEYNRDFILGLTKRLQNSKVSPFTVNAGAGQYIYYALPKRLGTCEFTVGVLTGGFGLVATIAFENAHGYTEDYYIYRSDNANLGSTTVSVA